MKKVTGTIDAWITDTSGLQPSDLAKPPADLANRLSYSEADMSGYGWIKIGRAEIAITIDDQYALVRNAITGLRAQQRDLMAEAERKSNAIERQIQTLQAITYEAPEAA